MGAAAPLHASHISAAADERFRKDCGIDTPPASAETLLYGKVMIKITKQLILFK